MLLCREVPFPETFKVGLIKGEKFHASLEREARVYPAADVLRNRTPVQVCRPLRGRAPSFLCW
jgi:hypothetical protein